MITSRGLQIEKLKGDDRIICSIPTHYHNLLENTYDSSKETGESFFAWSMRHVYFPTGNSTVGRLPIKPTNWYST